MQGSDRSGFADAVTAAASADVCVAVVGDLAGLFGQGSSGEGCDAEDLSLPGVQADLLEELLATGVPVVIVVVSGRPYALGAFAGRAAGLVQAFMPGEEGGAAIAGVLSGRVQPGGKLPVQIPRTPGGAARHLPAAAAGHAGRRRQQHRPHSAVPVRSRPLLHHLRTGRPADQRRPTYPPTASSPSPCGSETPAPGPATKWSSCTWRTRWHRWRGRPASSSVTPGCRWPPERKPTVTFTVHADRTSFTGADMDRIVEPGQLELLVGTSVADIACRGTVWLTGATRRVGAGRTLLTPVTVSADPTGNGHA